ncbi:HalOD1 output domain-containing protein [Natronorubrum halophilum]|uniref:HalOD1 output domain-containing protein n=1 Tax=Natronorubrum halophilum TaxID=1702106 RepID=UPI000EF6FF74|nr:HalOD1 output domain-containing protein [Natronorubrum halophilum]
MLLSVDRSDAATPESVSFAVIAAIADREGVDPMEIEPPEYEALYDVINPEALDALFAPREDGSKRASGRVEFPFCGYQVVVNSTGEVDVLERDGGR